MKNKDDQRMGDGDVVVIAVARHYAIARVGLGGTLEYLASQHDRAEAIRSARAWAGITHRLFLYPKSGTRDVIEINGEEILQNSRWSDA